MARVFLQDMVEDILFDALPVNWTSFDLETFSQTKQLWDYQQQAVENAIKVLWRYYGDFADDVNSLPQGYREYWVDDMEKILTRVLEDPQE